MDGDVASTVHRARGSACGKAIVVGEHFVVHGVEALAVPLVPMRTEVALWRGASDGPTLAVSGTADARPAVRALQRAAALCGLDPTDLHGEVLRSVPIGCGLGSSASLAVALVRACDRLAGRRSSAAHDAARAFEIEKLAHGTPSGIDNTVVALERPIRFRRGAPPRPLAPAAPIDLLLADTGVRHRTADAVAAVRDRARRRPDWFAALCAEAADVVAEACMAFAAADLVRLGAAMTASQRLLADVGVSSPAIEALVGAAHDAGALGAKLTGAGVGGCVLALVSPPRREAVAAALRAAGAEAVTAIRIAPHAHGGDA